MDAQWSLLYRNPKLLSFVLQFGQINTGVFGVFLADLSAHILILWVHCPCFSLINHYFYKKNYAFTSKYIDLGLGFEFGPHIIRDYAIMCPYSVMLTIKVKGNERFLTFFDMMSAGKIVLLFTIILHVSVPCFGVGLFWKVMNYHSAERQ